MARERTTFGADFKRFFVRGLAVLLPSVLTLWIVWQAYLFVDRQVAEPINKGIRAGVLWVLPRVLPEKSMPDWFVVNEEDTREFRQTLARLGTIEAQELLKRNDAELRRVLREQRFQRFWNGHWYFRFIGLLVAISLIYLAGVVLGGYIGRRIYQRVERVLTRVPVFKHVYPHVKQVVEMIFGEKQIAFSKVVLVEYPRKGIWTLGFVTSDGMRLVQATARESVYSVFIPSTPTPFTGFTITVKKAEAIELPITIDEAIRFVLTGGVLVPEGQQVNGKPTLFVPGGAAEAVSSGRPDGPMSEDGNGAGPG